jgi:hypothetical protein
MYKTDYVELSAANYILHTTTKNVKLRRTANYYTVYKYMRLKLTT